MALNFNLKLRRRNRYIDNNKLGGLAEGRTIAIGINVMCISLGSTINTPKTTGIVASVNYWLA
jgi:hypothetical protein